MDEPHEESHFLFHEACPKCGSSDNLGRYSDGHASCFSMGCNHYERGDGSASINYTNRRTTMAAELIPMESLEWVNLTKRKLTAESCRLWGYALSTHKGKRVHVANYKNNEGQVVAQKLRTADKNFSVLGKLKDALPLFGQNLWRDAARKIVITEGEIDAISVSQIQEHKWPVVSVPTGAAGAKKYLAKALSWLETFEEVVLLFDNDEAGQAAIEECSQLFSKGKCKSARLPLKDANAMLQVGRGAEVIDAIWNAREYRPPAVASVSDVRDEAIAMPEFGMDWPWPSLTKLTFGIHRKCAYYLGAGVGVGKTNWAKELQSWLVNEKGLPVGVFMLEESPGMTLKGIAGKFVGIPFHKPGSGFTHEQLVAGIDSLNGKVELYRHDKMGTEWDDIKAAIIYMVEGLGIKDIFLDNLTAMVAGHTAQEGNEIINTVAQDIAQLIQKHEFTLYGFSHLNSPKQGKDHEHGGKVYASQFTGSRGLMRFAQYIFGIERDKDSEDMTERNTSTFVLLKDRLFGNAGSFPIYYSSKTDQYLEQLDDTKGAQAQEDFNTGGEDTSLSDY